MAPGTCLLTQMTQKAHSIFCWILLITVHLTFPCIGLHWPLTSWNPCWHNGVPVSCPVVPVNTPEIPSLFPRQECSKSNQQELAFAFLLIIFEQASRPYGSINIPVLSTWLFVSLLLEKQHFKGQNLDSDRQIRSIWISVKGATRSRHRRKARAPLAEALSLGK